MLTALSIRSDNSFGLRGLARKEEQRRARFVMNLSSQSTHWPKGTVRMQTLLEFAMSLQEQDHMLSIDIKNGYRHLRLLLDMRDWFIFRYDGRYDQFVELSFVWGRSLLWFTQLIAPFLTELRKYGYRVLPYIEDFLIVPTLYGVVAQSEDCKRARLCIDRLMHTLGLHLHREKGEREGSRVVDHLEVRVNTVNMNFYVVPFKAKHIRNLTGSLLQQVRLGRRWVSPVAVRTFCGTYILSTAVGQVLYSLFILGYVSHSSTRRPRKISDIRSVCPRSMLLEPINRYRDV